MRGRGTEAEDKINIRLKTAVDEMVFGQTEGNFDAIITNNDLEVAYVEILSQIKSWYPTRFIDSSIQIEDTEFAEVFESTSK